MEPAKAAAIAQKSMVCASSCIAAAQFIVSIYEGKMDVVFGEIEQQQMRCLDGQPRFHYPKFGLIAKVDEVHNREQRQAANLARGFVALQPELPVDDVDVTMHPVEAEGEVDIEEVDGQHAKEAALKKGARSACGGTIFDLVPALDEIAVLVEHRTVARYFWPHHENDHAGHGRLHILLTRLF